MRRLGTHWVTALGYQIRSQCMRAVLRGKRITPETSMATIEQFQLAFRPKDAAHALGISPRMLWQLTRDGKIPHIRLGRCIRYPIKDLQAWMSQQQEGGAA
jgi:excisionase family DNA binding protein